MKPKYPLTGVVVSLNTPFDAAGRIDFESLSRSIEVHLKDGCSGFLAPAQAGEVGALTVQERIAIISFIQRQVSGRVAFIAGATASGEHESIAVADAALSAGCESILIEIPQQHRLDRQATLKFCKRIGQVGMPILAIQDLDWNGFGLDVSWIVELFETIDAFRLLKVEVRPAGPKYSQVIGATGGLLTVAGGWAADQMIEALDRGVDIYMPTAMTRLYRNVIDNHRMGNRSAALDWFHKLLPVLAFTRQHLDISIQFYKRLFHHRGIFSTTITRKSCLEYDSFHEHYGQELIRYLDQIDRS